MRSISNYKMCPCELAAVCLSPKCSEVYGTFSMTCKTYPPFHNSILPFPEEKEFQIRFEVNSLDLHSRLERVTRPLKHNRSFQVVAAYN